MRLTPTDADWAEAVATRIADEWYGMSGFSDDHAILHDVLRDLFILHPEHCNRLIGTGVIEENYFDYLEESFGIV